MARVLFSNTYNDSTYPEYNTLDTKIRLSIFLIAGECGGLPALVWALCVLYRHHKSGVRISAFIVVLLLNDMVELLLSPYIVAKLVNRETCWDTSTTCRVLSSLWGTSRTCGFHLQQVVVLESSLSQRHPFCSAQVFFPSCSIIVYIFAAICIFICEFFSLTALFLLSAFLVVALTIFSWIVTFRAAAAAQLNKLEKPDFTVLDIATFMMVLYLLWVIFWLEPVYLWVLWMMCGSLMSLRVIFDPLLCVLICRETLRVHRPQIDNVQH